MPFRLHHDLSFCEVDGRLIFLDVGKDRYFRLSKAMERAFSAYMKADHGPETDINGLVECGILVDTKTKADRVTHVAIDVPSRSALEQRVHVNPVPMATTLDVFGIVFRTKLQLKALGLKETLRRLAAYRCLATSRAANLTTDQPEQRLLELAAMFLRARSYVPIETRCLPDSIALVIFLAKRRLHANIVFGVTSDPFAAHCWVQAGQTILNDTIGNAATHTPIRVI